MKLTTTIFPTLLSLTAAVCRHSRHPDGGEHVLGRRLICGGSTRSFKVERLKEWPRTYVNVLCSRRRTWRSPSSPSFFGEGVRVRTFVGRPNPTTCQPSGVPSPRPTNNTFALSNAGGGSCYVPFADINDGRENPFKVWSFEIGVFPV